MSRQHLANESANIVSVCRLIGMPMPDFEFASSWKMYCPFGEVSHIDGGQAKAFRVYPETNTAYCFACGILYTPVRLLATAKDIEYDEAADMILEMAGVTEANSEERWAELTTPPTETVSTADLAEALKIFCARTVPNWKKRQLDADVSGLVQSCLDLLPRVRTQEDADKWLKAAKSVITKKLGEDRGVRQVVR
jgi:hypothetical protein